jgi:hypothetical protein
VPGRPARRVREVTRGNLPVEIPAGRPESTSHSQQVAAWSRLPTDCRGVAARGETSARFRGRPGFAAVIGRRPWAGHDVGPRGPETWSLPGRRPRPHVDSAASAGSDTSGTLAGSPGRPPKAGRAAACALECSAERLFALVAEPSSCSMRLRRWSRMVNPSGPARG